MAVAAHPGSNGIGERDITEMRVERVSHVAGRSVADSVRRVVGPRFTVVEIHNGGHLGLMLDGEIVCSTKSSGGRSLSRGIGGQHTDFLLKAPSYVFRSEATDESIVCGPRT